MSSLHDTDFYSWTEQQAALLRSNNIAALDIENLIEEIEDMGRSEKRELKSCLRVLLMHLLKWQHQPERQGKSWRITIRVQRECIQQCLLENPGLKPSCDTTLISAYKLARLDAIKETNLDEAIFPIDCPWNFTQVMDDDFWPE
ncbi:hypothetical protein TI03_01745 [Achromatium sp. WMS1]|nr:hypothetical protein TI03_01745 [Achromatium sp. WMS1]